MKTRNIRRLFTLLTAALLALAVCGTARAEDYSAASMRLLHYEGEVEILDASGNPRFIMENARFASGEAMRTGPQSSASVSLDATKILTLDADSRVGFFQQGGAMVLKLEKGALFLDVQEKLGENETLDIQTSNMTVGIRGTIVYVRSEPIEDEIGPGLMSTLGVLEGTAQVSWTDDRGRQQAAPVPAGNKAVVIDRIKETSAAPAQAPEVSLLEAEDVEGFVRELVTGDEQLFQRVTENNAYLIGADENWTWDGAVTLVAQSASKLYDGKALTRPGDVLVYGLPQVCSIRVNATGSQTDAGESENPIGSYTIYNAMGENVTSHFTHVETVSGRLVVDPLPLTVWTGSAEKLYDGEPLTNPEALLTSVPGYERDWQPWRNTSYVATQTLGSQTLYALCGAVWVHGTNPLTGETREVQLRVGQKMDVRLSDEAGAASIEMQISAVTEFSLPAEILRVYADNPDLMAQACAEAGWDAELLAKRIAALPAGEAANVEKNGLIVEAGASDRLMRDSTNVRINIDTQITSYNGRALAENEAHFAEVKIDDTIVVTATGSQTEVGSSPNTYTIDWGNANPANYALSEELGTLTVFAPEIHEDPVVLTARSASKVYDGKPLRASDVDVSGLPEGYSVEVTVSGSRTETGTGKSAVSEYRILDENGEDVTDQFTNVTTQSGTLTITPAPLTITTGSASKPFDGTPLTSAEVSVTGLAAGEGVTVAATGSQSDIGATKNTYSLKWSGANAGNYTLTEKLGTLEVTKNDTPIIITAASASKPFDNTDLTSEDFNVEGLPEDLFAVAQISGSQRKVGSSENSVVSYTIYSADEVDVTANFSNIATAPGTLEVTVNDGPITVTANSFSEVYDGYRTGGWYGVTVEGVPESVGYMADPEIYWEDVGAYNLHPFIDLYDPDTMESLNSCFTNITLVDGTLTVTPAPLSITTPSASKPYDGTPLTGGEATVTGLVGEDAITVTCTGTITDAGSISNSCSIDWGSTNPDNYTVSESLGTLTVTPLVRDLNITLVGQTVTYGDYAWTDVTGTCGGEACTSWRFSSPGGNAKNGWRLSCSYCTVDVYPNAFMDFSVGTHPLSCEYEFISGNAEDFNVTVTAGANVVNPAPLTIATPSASKVYDGQPLTGGEATVTGLVKEDAITVTCTGTITDAGTAQNTCTIDWGDVNPANYEVTQNLGTLEVTPNGTPITITSGSASQVFNGTALTCDESAVDGLPEGYFCVAEISGSQTDAGESENAVSGYTIYDAAENDVTDCFSNVTVEEGKLTVEKLRIGINPRTDNTFVYDGNLHYIHISVLAGNEAPRTSLTPVDQGNGHYRVTMDWGDVVDIEMGRKETNVGEYFFSSGTGIWATASVVSGSADNYQFAYGGGSVYLTVEKLRIGIDPRTDNTFVYDGNLHYIHISVLAGNEAPRTSLTPVDQGNGHYRVTMDWGDVVDIEMGRKETDVGEYSFTPGSGAWATASVVSGNAEDYQFAYGGGAVYLIITPGATPSRAPLTISTGSYSKPYDGTPLTDAVGPTVSGELTGGDALVFGAPPSITDAGSVENSVDYSFNPGNADSYDITTDFGTLTVSPLSVNVGAIGYEVEYDGSWYTPDGFTGSCEGEALEFVDYSFEKSGSGATITAYAELPGGTIKVQCAGVKEVGTHTLKPSVTLVEGKASNYNITASSTTMTITEPEKAILTLNVQGMTYTYDGEAHGPENVTAKWSGPFSSVTLRSSNMTTGDGGLPRLVVEYDVSGNFGFNIVTVECQWQKEIGTYTLPTAQSMSGDGGIEIQFTNTTMKIQ